ncbi:MAG: winged helix-turn-helix transcriptional regulator [Alphaproteobacteria bacterium]|nr:winged helix-turn-helix transcriptional regulator [Alphaproteobacteria bacterium]
MEGLAALGDPTRRRIVEMLAAGELSAGEIGARFAVTAPAISQHLKVLREAQLVRVRPQAQRRIYALDPAGLVALDDWLARVRRFWTERLDALERHLAADAAAPPRKRAGKRGSRR